MFSLCAGLLSAASAPVHTRGSVSCCELLWPAPRPAGPPAFCCPAAAAGSPAGSAGLCRPGALLSMCRAGPRGWCLRLQRQQERQGRTQGSRHAASLHILGPGAHGSAWRGDVLGLPLVDKIHGVHLVQVLGREHLQAGEPLRPQLLSMQGRAAAA